jgi:autotransporter-associated beta strand protein
MFTRDMRVLAGVVAVCLCLLPGTGGAATRTWSVSSNGYWTYGPNWGGTAPLSGDSARINNGYTAWVQPGDAAVCSTLYLGYGSGDSGHLSMWGGTLTAGSMAYIGNSGTGEFTVSGGTVSFDGAYVGRNNAGTLSISNSGTSVDVTGNLYVGYGSTGTVTLSDGSLTADNYINIGETGTGYLTQYSGTLAAATVSESADVRLGVSSGGHGYYTMYGGSVNTCDLYVGMSGTGSFSQSGGIVNIANQGTADHHLYLGSATGGSGTYRLSGTGIIQLCLNNHGSTIFVGSGNGTGRFEWFRTGGISRPSGGSNPMMKLTANGTLAMGAAFNVGDLCYGNIISPIEGLDVGTLEVTNGATATHNWGDVTLGKLRVGSDATGAGTYTFTGGSLNGGGAIDVGTASTAGRFEWFRNGGINNSPTMTVGTHGTLAMGYGFNVNTLGSGGYIPLSGLNLAGLEVTNGCTATHDQGDWTVRALRIGSATGAGTYNLGGTVSAIGRVSEDLYLGAAGNLGTLNIGANGQAIITGNIVGASGASTVNLNRSEGLSFGTSFSLDTFNIGPTSAAQFSLNGGESLTAASINVGSGVTGTLSIGAQNVSVGSLTLRNGTVSGSSGTITATSSYTMESGTASANLAGNASLTKQTSGTVTLSNSGNSYGGSTYINGGTLVVAANGCLGTQYGHVDFDTGTLRTTASFDTPRDMSMNAGGGGTFEVDSGTTLTHHGVIGGAGSLTKTGSGILYLYTTANNWAGGTYINGGELWTGNSSVIPNNLVSINSATLNLKSHTEGIGALSLASGVVAASGGTLSLGGNVTSSGTSSIGDSVSLGTNRTFNVTGGTLTVGGLVTGSGQTVTLSGAGNAKILMGSAGTSNASYTAVTGGGRMLGGDNTGGTALFTGNISLNKEVTLAANVGGTAEFSTGTWATNNNAVNVGAADHTGIVKLSNSLSTSAAVAVNYGTLLVNGTLTGGGSSIAVAGGATLGGTGTLGKPVVIDGTLSPGSSPGTLTFSNSADLTLDGGGVCYFELGASSSYDQVTGVQALTYGGWLNVVNYSGGPSYSAGQQYTLFSAAGHGGMFTSVSLPQLPGGLQWKVFDGSQPFDYDHGLIEVETATADAHYSLSAEIGCPTRNVLVNGTVGLTGTITDSGTAPMDTLDFTGLRAICGAGGMVIGPGIDDSDVPYGDSRTNAALTFRGIAYTDVVPVLATVATATGHTGHNPAVLDQNDTIRVNVGLATAGKGANRTEFGPALFGQGSLKGGAPPVREYKNLASKTKPGTWEDGKVTVGTEAIIREGTDVSAAHTVSMEWRQRYDGMVNGEPGSEIPETTTLYSDVMKLTGMDTGSGQGPDERRPSDAFVLQMTYVDGQDYPGKPHWVVYMNLGLDGMVGGVDDNADKWTVAVQGDFGGMAQPPVGLSWDDFRLLHPEPISKMVGYCGWQGDGLGTGAAWAVLDYNNAQFAVPEPATLALLALGAGALFLRRRGRR